MNLPAFALNDENQEGKKNPFSTKQAVLSFPSLNKCQGRFRDSC